MYLSLAEEIKSIHRESDVNLEFLCDRHLLPVLVLDDQIITSSAEEEVREK